MLVASGGYGKEQQSRVATSSLQAGVAAHRATHRAWTATAQNSHENGSGDPNHAQETMSHTPSVQLMEKRWEWGELGHIYVSGSEQQWRTSQLTAKFN